MRALRVLIFEADPTFAEVLCGAFARRGCAVTVSDDGQTGLEVAMNDRPDLIVLCIELPRMNGFAVCNRIKKHTEMKDIPLVIISGESPPETFEQHSKLRTRAEDYAHKPIDPEALVERCGHFVKLPPLPPGEEIVVDDVMVEEVTPEEPAPRDRRSHIDSEVEGLTDAAFENILLEPEAATPWQGSQSAEFEDFSAVPRADPVSPSLAALNTETPRVDRAPPGSRPTPLGIAPVSIQKVDSEAPKLRARVTELERGMAEAQNERARAEALAAEVATLRGRADEAARLRRELDELKAKPVAAPQRALGSPRELLELREGLHRKDKEILQVRETLNQRDRELLELQEKSLQFELERADADERLAERDREIEAARAELEVAKRSHDEAVLAADARTDEARARGAAADRAVAEAIERHGREIDERRRTAEAARAEVEARVAAASAKIATLEEALVLAEELAAKERESRAAEVSALRDEQGHALGEAREAHGAAMGLLRGDHAKTEAELRGRIERALAEKEQSAREAEERLAATESAHRVDAAKAASVHTAEVASLQAAAEEARTAQADAVRTVEFECEREREGRASAAALAAKYERERDEARSDASDLRAQLRSAREAADALRAKAAQEAEVLSRARRAIEIAAGLMEAAAGVGAPRREGSAEAR